MENTKSWTLEELYALPEEIALRMLERTVNWVGNEGPAELGKLEALYDALADAMDTGRFRRTGLLRYRHRNPLENRIPGWYRRNAHACHPVTTCSLLNAGRLRR